MSTVPVPCDPLPAAIERVATDLSNLVEPLAGPSACLGGWSTLDVAAHVNDGLDLHRRLLDGEPSPVEAGAEADHAQIAVGERRGTAAAELAADLRRSGSELRRAAEASEGVATVHWHGGRSLPSSAVVALALAELLIHGDDLARATGARWSIPRRLATEVILGLMGQLTLSGVMRR